MAMQRTVLTERLKLTLLESAEEGGRDLEYVFRVRRNEQATGWSTAGPARTLADAQKFMIDYLLPKPGDENEYRIPYAVHRLTDQIGTDPSDPPSEVIGICTLKPAYTLPIPDSLAVRTDRDAGVLRLEVGYCFLPTAWGKGYATEACLAVLDACRASREFFKPFNKLYVEAIVGPDNPASVNVLSKAGLEEKGLHEWEGEHVYLAGAWRPPKVLVYGTWVFE